MSDFGFDTVAFAGDGAAPTSHPLEIARELIARGQPRQALDVLSEHHDMLADDPEYLLACSEAWWAEGDALRAQQALLGATRLVPDDPTPLVLLAELLREQGEDDKADLILAKAEALGPAPRVSQPGEPASEEPDFEDDLIAAAELRERRTRVGLTPRQAVVTVVALLSVSAVVVGIGKLTAPALEPQQPEPQQSEPQKELELEAQTEPLQAEPEPQALSERESQGPEVAAVATEEALPAAAVEAAPVPEQEPPVATTTTPTREVVANDGAPLGKSTNVEPVTPAEPSLPVVPDIVKPVAKKKPSIAKPPEHKPLLPLTDDDKRALTKQGDALHAKGQTGLAASYYRRALEVDPDYAPALVGIGRSLLRAEKYDEAFDNATRALQLARGVDSRPGLEAEAIYQLGRFHLQREDLDAARRLFRQSTSLSRPPAEAWFYLGEALWNDNSPAARSAYETYLEKVPSGHLAERARRAIQ